MNLAQWHGAIFIGKIEVPDSESDKVFRKWFEVFSSLGYFMLVVLLCEMVLDILMVFHELKCLHFVNYPKNWC